MPVLAIILRSNGQNTIFLSFSLDHFDWKEKYHRQWNLFIHFPFFHSIMSSNKFCLFHSHSHFSHLIEFWLLLNSLFGAHRLLSDGYQKSKVKRERGTIKKRILWRKKLCVFIILQMISLRASLKTCVYVYGDIIFVCERVWMLLFFHLYLPLLLLFWIKISKASSYEEWSGRREIKYFFGTLASGHNSEIQYNSPHQYCV